MHLIYKILGISWIKMKLESVDEGTVISFTNAFVRYSIVIYLIVMYKIAYYNVIMITITVKDNLNFALII